MRKMLDYCTRLSFGSQNVMWKELSESYRDAEHIEKLWSHPIPPDNITGDSCLTAAWPRHKLV